MESVIEHALEPELLAPVPRRLHLPPQAWLLLTVASLLLCAFILGSGCALWEGVKLFWLARTGHTVNGTIVEIRTDLPQAKGQTPHQSAVRFTVILPGAHGLLPETGWIVLADPQTLPGRETVPPRSQTTPQFHLGQPFPLRSASVFGMTLCQPWGPNPASRILSLLLAGGLVMAVSLLLLRRLLHWTGGRLHLLRVGTATVGTVTHKRSEAEDMVRYFLRYGYADSAAQGQDREEQVSAEQWREFHVGQPITVLYDPVNPQHAGLYALITQK